MNVLSNQELTEKLLRLEQAFLDSRQREINNTYRSEEAKQEVTQLDSKLNEAVYPEWNPDGYDYFAGEKVSFNDAYYRCIQNHKSQPDWAPGVAVSLWAPISDPSEEWPDWKQPTGAHDAYQKGDKVSHNEKHWISDVDNNVWEPSVYGWTEAE